MDALGDASCCRMGEEPLHFLAGESPSWSGTNDGRRRPLSNSFLKWICFRDGSPIFR